jgi:fibronectin-binding autotransporter adhesin
MMRFAKAVRTLLACGLVAALPAVAQTWTGAGPDNNWSTGANWSGGVPPASSATTQLTFDFSPRPSPVVDLPWTVNRMTFSSAYSLSGQAITLDGASPLITAGFTTVTIPNPIVLATPSVVSGVAAAINLNGTISGPGSLTVSTGSGGASLTGPNTYTGGTTINAGTLALTGSILGPVTVDFLGILTGSGTVSGPVTTTSAQATLIPNRVLGIGNLAMAAGSGLSIVIDGPGASTSLNVTGTVDISGARLDLQGAYTPVAGDVFTIIANDGTDAVTGTFAGLPEGGTVAFNGVPLRISYAGGTGNDVTLTALAAVAVTDVRQVPTLSEWALMVLASLVLGVGMMRSRRRP